MSKLCTITIRFVLEDQFGDGWDGAKLILLSSSGQMLSATLSCEQQEAELKFCFSMYSNSADDYLVASVVGVPDKPWEVHLPLFYLSILLALNLVHYFSQILWKAYASASLYYLGWSRH